MTSLWKGRTNRKGEAPTRRICLRPQVWRRRSFVLLFSAFVLKEYFYLCFLNAKDWTLTVHSESTSLFYILSCCIPPHQSTIHKVVPKPLLCCRCLCVCLGSLSLWKVNLVPCLRSWALWTRLSLRDLCTLFHSAFPQPWQVSQSLPLKTALQHDAATTMLYCWDGTMQVMIRFSPDVMLRIEAKLFKFGFSRPDNLVAGSSSNFALFDQSNT